MQVEFLRTRYPEFIYKSFQPELTNGNLEVDFNFQIPPNIEFKPKIVVKNIPRQSLDALPQGVLDNFAFHIGLAEIPSYWKSTCSPQITIEAGQLDDYQKSWWNKLLFEGMGQFFWENKIEVSPNFISIKSEGTTFAGPAQVGGRKILIAVGGGKDSAVTLQLLGRRKPLAGVFILNPIPASEKLAQITQIVERVVVERTIDPKLLDLNTEGFLNGHTPFSSYLAFLSNFCASLYGYSDVAFSNERSSDEANTTFNGRKINHQYSKTTEFEKDFREYGRRYLSNVRYFSFLRPLHELQIAKLFSQMPQYFDAFRGCNVGQKKDAWCEHCSKCLSTYVLLYPFLELSQIKRIFPHDLFEDLSLYPLLERLTRNDMVKPFECVGTRVELKAALALASKKLEGARISLPNILERAKNDGLFDESMVSVADSLLKDWNDNNFLDEDLKNLLKNALQQSE